MSRQYEMGELSPPNNGSRNHKGSLVGFGVPHFREDFGNVHGDDHGSADDEQDNDDPAQFGFRREITVPNRRNGHHDEVDGSVEGKVFLNQIHQRRGAKDKRHSDEARFEDLPLNRTEVGENKAVGSKYAKRADCTEDSEEPEVLRE